MILIWSPRVVTMEHMMCMLLHIIMIEEGPKIVIISILSYIVSGCYGISKTRIHLNSKIKKQPKTKKKKHDKKFLLLESYYYLLK